MKASIKSFKTELVSFGHWRVTIVADNPALLLSDNDSYWETNDREDEPAEVTLIHTTTDSRAIDGHDGGNAVLAEECIMANDWSTDMFDLSEL